MSACPSNSAFWQSSGWFLPFTFSCLLASQARAGLTLDLELQRLNFENNQYYGCSPYLTTNTTGAAVPFGQYRIASPNQPNSGFNLSFTFDSNGFNLTGGGGSLYDRFDEFMQNVTNGNWTISLTNSSVSNVYFFTVSAGIASNAMPTVLMTFPTNGASNVASQPTFTWEGPAAWPGSPELEVHDLDYNYYQTAADQLGGPLAPSATSYPWMSPIPDGTNYARVTYRSNFTSLVIASLPQDAGLNPLGGWISTARLTTYADSQFSVGTPIPPGDSATHLLIGRFDFEDLGSLGSDTSGNDNGANGGTTWGSPDKDFDNDAAVGGHAAIFHGSGTLDWSSPSQGFFRLRETLAGSFAVAAWIKTANSIGSDQDEAVAGANLLWDNADSNGVIPLSITGSKLAFFTGAGSGSGDTLHSATTINDGNYHHVVVTRDIRTGHKRIYVDGQLDASGTGTTERLGGNDEKLSLGGSVQAIFNSYAGLVDDLQIYSGTLDETEVAALFNNPGSTVADVVSPGIVAHYNFDQDPTASDVSGNGNAVLLAGAFGGGNPTLNGDSVAGGGSIQFTSESYLSASHNLLNTLARSFSISLWVKTAQTLGSEGDFAFDGAGVVAADVGGEANDLVPIALTGGQVAFNTGGGGGDETLNSSTLVNDDSWHHIVVTRHQETGEKKIYIDGSLDASAFGSTELLNAPQLLTIGASSEASDPSPDSPQFNGYNGFEGLLDDFQLYSGVLSDAEVAFLYQHPGSTITNHNGSVRTLGDAVNAPALTWTTGGSASWFVESATQHDGVDAVQSGMIGDDQESWVQTTVTGPVTLSFWWNVSCEEFVGDVGDRLRFDVDGSEQEYISGDWGWDRYELTIPPGTHTLRWTYVKDSANSAGADAAWLDEVVLDPNVAPAVTFTPGAVRGFTGTNISLTVQFYGYPPPTLRWFKDNALLPDQTNATLTLNDAQPSASGYYQLTASNSLGMASSGGVTIIVSDPTDLQPVSLSAPALAGSQTLVPISWVGTNSGPGYASNAVDYLYLATNGTYVAFVGQMNRSFVVAPGATYALSNLFRLPGVVAGDYTLVVAADYFDGAFEVNETNNSLSIPISIINPDLQPGNLTAPPVGVGGLGLQIIYNITNNGPAIIDGAAWTDHLVLSLDDQWSDDDLNLLQPGYTANIGVGQFLRRTNNVILPVVPSGNYFIVVRLDRFGFGDYGNFREVNESNNVAAIPIQITVPDLVPAQILALAQASPKQPLELEWHVQNVGDATARNRIPALGYWFDSLYLSTNGLVHPGAIKLGVYFDTFYSTQDFIWNMPLPPGQYLTNRQPFNVPNVAEGNYFIVLVADAHDDVRELVETNNLLAVPISIASPDLVPASLTAPGLADAQSQIPVAWTVQNQGAGDAQPDWRDRIYLSTNNTFESSDILLGEFTQTSVVASGTNYSATNNVLVPGVAPGNYFLIFRADATTNLYESSVTNNYLTRAINIASPDLSATSFHAPTNYASQESFSSSWVVANVGSTTAQPFWADRLYVSRDASLDGEDVPVFGIDGQSQNFLRDGPLPISESYTQNVDVRMPALPAGDYFLLLQTDATNSFAEVNEGNNFFVQPIHIDNPDLLPTNLIAPPSITITQLNQRLEVGWNVINQNTGVVQVGWNDNVYLSTTNVLDNSAVFIGGQGVAGNLGLNESYQAFANTALPNGIEGSFYLLIAADAGNNVYESNETNNVLAQLLQVIVPPVPDLSVVQITTPLVALSGQEIELTWVLTNRGHASALGPFRDRVYLATSAAGDGLVEYGNFDFTATIAPGESVTRTHRISLPISLSGQYWVVVTTDVNNDVFEFTHENNNSLIASEPVNVILAPTPNLQVNSVTAPADAFSGQPILVTWNVTNSGTGPTSSPLWYDGVYLSPDTNFGNDTFLAAIPNLAYLGPGESYASAALVTIPRGFNGTHHIFVQTDIYNSLFENTKENDNAAISDAMFITLTPPPDLRVTAVNPPLNAFSGQPVQISWAVTNLGAGQTLESQWFDRVYLSTNSTIEPGDYDLGVLIHNGALDAGQGYRATNTVNLPVGVVGNWYLLVRCDALNQVFETPFDGNNDGAPPFATAIALTPPPDLAATILQSPGNALASHVLSVTYRVANEGTTVTPNSSWVDRLSLATDTNFNSSTDLEIGVVSHYGALAPGSAYTNTIKAALPDGLEGAFHIFLKSDRDSSVFELDKANNIALASNAVIVVSQPADLAVRWLTAPAAVEAGTALLVSWSVTNRSAGDSAATRWYDRLVLSSDDFVGDNDDVSLLDFQHDGLLGGTNEYVVNNVVAVIPPKTSPGNYRLFVIADRGNGVFEGTNENNNTSSPLPITITVQTPDLAVNSAEGPASAISGSPLTVQWVVKNQGTRSPNPASWVDALYLSSDTFLSPDDIQLGLRGSRTPLMPGASYTNTLTASLPDLAGDYYLLVVADAYGAIFEPGLVANNTYVTPTPISITFSPVPDLAVTEVSAPDDAYSGQPFEVSWTVQNVGTAAANGVWHDAVYLSLDHFLDPLADKYLGFTDHPGPLAPGESYTNAASFQVPQGFSGPFFVLVSSDTSGAVYERGAKENNKSFDPQPMLVHLTPPVDLVAGPITVPANAAPGVNATISYTVYNYGSNTALGSWDDAIYISADTNFDVGDALFGRVHHVGDVLPGGSYTTNLTAALPGVLPGDYHVIIHSDILNHLVEPDRTNNLGASLDTAAIDSALLTLGNPANGVIDQGQSVFYKFNATAGTTVRIRFTTGAPLAGNEIYVSHGQMPSRASFDFAANEPFIADPELFIPIQHTGTHYLMVYCGAMPLPTPYSILAEELPFTVATTEPNIAGDKGQTTFKVRGALFDAGTVFELTTATNSITASDVALADSSTAYVRFNLVGVPQGWWDIKASLNATSGVVSVLSNAVLVVSGRGPVADVAIDGALEARANVVQPVLMFYGNSGDSDAGAPLLIAEGIGGTLVGSDLNHLVSSPLEILGRSLEGPDDRLRPQTAFSHRMYYLGGELTVHARVVRADDARGITDADWQEIESSVRPFGLADTDWQAFWANVRPRIGDTWGDYVQFLHRVAANFPPEERLVRDMIGSIYTNRPGFRASSYLSGVVLGSTNNLPQADVELGFYLATTDGAIVLGGSATTDANGQFLVPQIQPGTYVCVADNSQFINFDMDRDGEADANPPRFVVPEDGDLPNQSIYLHQPAQPAIVINDNDAKLVVDSFGVLHALWYREHHLWHAWNDADTWVDATRLTTNVVSDMAVASGGKLLDGNAPGLIVVWSQRAAAAGGMDLFYAVCQTNGTGYRWSQPVQLTSDLVANDSPAVVVRADGLALISYLKHSLFYDDDTDVYYSGVNVASGELLWNAPAPLPKADQAKLTFPVKQTFKWSKSFPVKLLGVKAALGGEASGEFGSLDCDAGATAAFGAFLQVENPEWSVKGSLSGDLAFSYYVDPDLCDWLYLENSATANFHGSVTLGVKNIVYKTLEFFPAAAPFSRSLEYTVESLGRQLGVEFENALEIEGKIDLLNGQWKKQPPAGGFGHPVFQSADVSLAGSIKFGVKAVGAEDFKVNLNTDYEEPPGTKLSGSAGVQISGTAQFYPSWQNKTLRFTPLFEICYGTHCWSPPLPELVLQGDSARPYTALARGTNIFEQGTWTYNPGLAIGTTNVYGTNSLLPNVQLDLWRDGGPALALDAAGVPYQIWFRELNPYGPEYGSDLRMADFNGSDWTAPAVIPGTHGFNRQVAAATDRLGHRMAVWAHADAGSVHTNSTAVEFFAAREAMDLHYAVFDGASWSTPQPVALTEGPDGGVQVSYLTNGDVLAVWTYGDTNDLVHLLAASWDGTTWTAPQEVATGNIRNPAAQQIAGVTYLLWTAGVDTNRNKGLFQSLNVGGVWSAPEVFGPKPAARLATVASAEANYPLLAARGTDFLFGEIPDKCCQCKGKTTDTKPTGKDQGCGVALVKYDYEHCKRIFEFKACGHRPSDPNDILGPDGFGPERWVPANSPLDYTIRFENDPNVANAAARDVLITLALDDDMDPRTFRLGNFGFGDLTLTVPENTSFYQTLFDLTRERGFYLNFFAGVDVVKREAFWRLTTIDPATGFLPLDPQLGFLPVNITAPEGEGFVNFTIKPNAATATGARLDAKATIVFDTQPPLDTPPTFNSVEAGAPTSAVLPLPALTNQPTFLVRWNASDPDGESGLAGVDVFVSEDGGLFFPWLQDTTLSQAPFVGQYGVQYSFYTVAKDNAGNVEPAPLLPDATTLVVSPNTPPVLTNVADLEIVETIPFTLAISATDTDAPPNTLTFELLESPPGMLIGSASGVVTWTPSESQGPDTNRVTVRVTDDGVPPLSATNTFTIRVLETNSPPQFVGTNLYFVDELSLLSLTNRFTDPDLPTNHVTLFLVSAPTNASFNPLTGVLTWSPTEADGPSTNNVVIRATDDGDPAASVVQTNIVIVSEVNTPPVFLPTTNHLSPVLTLVRTTLRAHDDDVPTNALTYSLDLNAPASATLNPQTGDFRWTPGLGDAGSSNFITVLATDNGMPPLSATQHFSVLVPHFVQLELGNINVFSGQTGGVPVSVLSSAPWRMLSFDLELPAGALGQLSLGDIVSPLTTAVLTPVDALHSTLSFSNAPGHELQGTQLLAQFNFQAVSPISASVLLSPFNFSALFPDGSPFMTTFLNQGRVVIVADQPVLDAGTLLSNRHVLQLYGNPGQTYGLLTATNLTPPVLWMPFAEVTLSNIVQTIVGETNGAPLRVYRAQEQ